jgi:hypothetical protein
MDELTQRLTTVQPIVMGGQEPSLEKLRERVEELEYVLIKFTETRGGTELGIQLDRESSNTSEAKFDEGSGSVHLEGTLTLNYDPVRLIADLDLATLKGTGRLVPVEESAIASG